MSGKSQFPFMIDPNNGDKQMLESDAIIQYLWDEYGDGQVGGSVFPFSGSLPSLRLENHALHALQICAVVSHVPRKEH